MKEQECISLQRGIWLYKIGESKKMILKENIEKEVIEIIESVVDGIVHSNDDYLEDDLKLSIKDIHLIQDQLEEKYDIVIYTADSSKWDVVEDIIVSVCEALTEQGYIVVPKEDIESI